MKDCINPVAYGQCISLTKGKCLHKGFCEPIDQEGNRYTMIAFKEGERTLCYIRVPYVAPIIDAEAKQRQAYNAATKGRFARPVVTEEPVPSPHPFMDDITNRYRIIKQVCCACPATENCTISGEPSAPRRCKKLEKALS